MVVGAESERRVRDFRYILFEPLPTESNLWRIRYNRHEYVVKLPGAFHLEMSAEDALFRAHWGCTGDETTTRSLQ